MLNELRIGFNVQQITLYHSNVEYYVVNIQWQSANKKQATPTFSHTFSPAATFLVRYTCRICHQIIQHFFAPWLLLDFD